MNGSPHHLSTSAAQPHRGKTNDRRRPPRRRRGIVIVVVTVVILLISLAAYGFLMLMQTENKAAAARGDQLQAQAVALSGREYLAAILELPRSQRDELLAGDAESLFGQVVVDDDSEDSEPAARQGRFSLLVPAVDDAAQHSWRFGFVNESTKIHLAMLLDLDRRSPGAAREALMNLPNMDETAADAILDWIDPDDQARDQGAESEYYAGLSPPLRPRNGVPPNLEELLLVKGVTRERLFGPDLNGNFRVDAFEQQQGEQQPPALSAGALGWCRYLTVYSRERDETADGSPRIQLNQPNLADLHRELSAAFGAEWANFIVAYRQFGPHRGSGTADEVANMPMDFSRPAQRRIRSPLELIGVRVGIPQPADQKSANGSSSQPQTKVYTTPFVDDPVQMREYLPRLMDGVTTGEGAPLVGRVNVNLAPVEVLAALPGVDAALADRIVSARGMGGDDAQDHAVWLLLEELVDRRTMMRLDRYVTTGGDVARAQIAGYYDSRSPVVRWETVVDGTSAVARQVYYKDLRRLGRGVVDELLNMSSSP